MVVGTMLLSKKANLLLYDPNKQPPWWPLKDDKGAATTVDIQVYEQSNGRFPIVANHAITRAVVLDFYLNQVQYVVKEPAWHEVTVNDERYAIQFNGEKDGQGFATIVQNSLHEIKRADNGRLGNIGIPLPGLSSPRVAKEAWMPPGGIPQPGMMKAGTLPATRPAVPSRQAPPPPPINTAPRRPVDLPKVPTHEELMLAIARGDVNAAKTIVSMLADKKAQLNISPSPNARPSRVDKGQQTINIRVHIEDKFTSGGRIPLKVKPTMTVAELKKEISDKYSFPEQVQQWIVGKRLAKDGDTLERLGVLPNSSVYLYLKSAESVNLTKEQYENEKLAQLYPEQNQGTQQPGVVDTARSQSAQLGAVGGAVGGQASPRQQQDLLFNLLPGDERVDNKTRGNQLAATHIGVVRDHGDYQETSSRRPTQPPPPPPQTQRQQSRVGWECPQCTFFNEPTRPGCEICAADKPDDFVLPADYELTERERERLNEEARNRELLQQAQEREEQLRLQQRQVNFAQLLAAAEDQALIPNQEEFDCLICFVPIDPGEGVVLRNCLHSFCRDCLRDHINLNDEAEVMCPFQDDTYSCQSPIADREVKALVSADQYQRFLQRSLHTAENMAPDSYHCKTPDCQGWCYYDDNINFFDCMICHKRNCLTCKAIHEGLDCKQYQDDLRRRADNDLAAKQTKEMLEQLVDDGEAMHCPRCNIILQKKEGCDWLRCTMCKLEICWVTKGPRWGVNGQGDVSGGCRCRVNGRKCHPNCRNCH